MRTMFFGDIVGPEAVDHLCARLPKWRAENAIDLVVANAENAAVNYMAPLSRGFGITAPQAGALRAAGVDVITGGNHSWDAGAQAYDDPRVLRPENIDGSLPGRGFCSLRVGGRDIVVVNLIGPMALGPVARATNPLLAFERIVDAHHDALFIIDYHGDFVTEKQAFAYAVDGRALGVFGTHVHEPTLRLHRLPLGTFFVAEVGMTGRLGGIVGIGARAFDVRTRHEPGHTWDLAMGPMDVGAVIFESDDTGVTRSIVRFEPEPV